ncbi:unnamed protein product [Polarella glacialis]|uniref:Uncharacterized protein n=1 Tax=Polarella glacialis TaxID=89957 RepID=A0A813L697_POLGL|nr:unnamed protein product [Polarella glacialis]
MAKMRPYQLQFLESGCNGKMWLEDDWQRYSGMAMNMVEEMNDLVKPILFETSTWPYREAIARLERTANATEEAIRSFPAILGTEGVITLEFVIVHCREPLDWVEADLLPITPAGTALTFYEKCGEQPQLPGSVRSHFGPIQIKPCRDPVGGARGDECLGYLAHLVPNYGNLATFTVFLQADPHEHLHFAYLHIALKMIARGTYAVPYLALNGARHVRSYTPCLNAVHEAIFGKPMADAVGPYCCAQFIVQNARVRERPLAFYENMLRLVDGSMDYDLCAGGKVTRSTHCYGMEFTWHLVFGEDYEEPLRQDDQRLPMPLRLKWGTEFVRTDWNDVVLNPSTPKKIVEEVDYSQMTTR